MGVRRNSGHHQGKLTAKSFKGNADGATKADNKRIKSAAAKVNRVSGVTSDKHARKQNNKNG